MPRDCWNHVSSVENPADCASRGMSPRVLKKHDLWWHGPHWLKLTREHWPKQRSEYHNCEEEVLSTHTRLLVLHNQWFDDIICTHSSFAKLQRQLCYIFRFIENARKPKELRAKGRFLQRQELLASLRYICLYDQSLFFQSEISCLKGQKGLSKSSMLLPLTPILDEYGLLRVGGRLQHSDLPYDTKHPIIMHRNSKITKKILSENHIKYHHAGPTLLAHITRQEFWIPRGRNAAKTVIRECVICAKNKAKLQTPLMGNLPAPRVTASRPFLQCGVDYAGPLSIHLKRGRGQRVHKAYICIFVCLAIKAVHIELVGDMTSVSFMAALKRFVARRGVPRDIYSDNGTNFVGANKILQSTFTKLITESSTLSNYASQMYINWHFIPPQAPHFGGIWESAVKSTKFHLRRVIGATILTMEEMITLLTEIEGILNSRPLCATIEPDVEVLTPSHFLIGHDNLKIPEEDITGIKLSQFTRWQMVQRLSQSFWKRWQVEYLTALNQRRKWNTISQPVAVDDIVMIKDSNAHICQWLMGRITSVTPGTDGIIRVATIKTKLGEYKRAVHSLCVLPVIKPDSTGNSLNKIQSEDDVPQDDLTSNAI